MRAGLGSRFVGRTAELAGLRAHVDSVCAGEGRLVLLTGEAGVGKTRLAQALGAQAREQGARLVWGRCHEREGAPVYWPWIQALSACAVEGGEAARATIDPLLEELRAHAASLHERDPGRARFELFERVAGALAGVARGRPLVLVLDDLHWADAGSLLLLEFAARELAAERVLLLATRRDAEPPGCAEREKLLAAVVRLARNVPIAGLARDEVGELLAARLGRDADPALLEEVVALTDGNPFFVIEVAHLLDGAPPGRARAVPPGVQELLRRRLEPLAPAELGLLQAAAVLGREFHLDALARALGEPIDVLLERLSRPLALGLVREASAALGRYAFAHALSRETLRQGLAPGARASLHGALARALEAGLDPRDDERLPALAHHYFEAGRAGDPARAVSYGCEAGEHALGLFAFDEATGHFERALAALALAPDVRARARACAGLGDALYGAGDAARAEEVYAEALELARPLGGDVFADTVLRLARARGQLMRPDLDTNALLEQALAVAPEPTALRARLLARLAAGLSLQADQAERRHALSDEACALARSLGDASVLCFVLSRRLYALAGPEHIAERLAISEEILRLAPATRTVALEALMARIDDVAELGDRRALDEALDAFAQRARASRDPAVAWNLLSFRAAMALLEGRLSEAESLAHEAFALGSKVERRMPGLRFAQQLFQLRGWQARLAEVEPLLDRSVAQTAVVPSWRAALAEFYCVCGREVEARREFEALAADDFAMMPLDATALVGVVLLADTCVRLRDVARAESLYARLLPYADRIAIARPLIVVTAPVAARLATLATLLGRHDDAERHFAHALEVAERMRALPWRAEIRQRQAELACARGERERGLRLLEEAEAIAKPLGLALVLGWIAQTRARLGADASSSRTGALRRDGDVWTLVFEGRTTRVRDMVGLGHLARLLADPGREIHACDLAGRGAERLPPGDAGELLDARARADYESRLRDAGEELAEAKRDNDGGRIERLGIEIEFLAAELSRGFGIGGRARRASSAEERARVSVTRAIKYAIERIAEHDPALAEHLRLGVRTGTYCVYAPSPRDPVSWGARAGGGA